MPAPTLDDLFASPDHYFHSFAGDEAVFVRMDRAAYARSIFLDDRIQPLAPGAMRVPLTMLKPRPAQRAAWIFHIAHCGSTLLARALDELGRGLVLREPLALRQVGVAPDPARLALVLGMLGKRYPREGLTLVKANVPVNFILSDIAAADPEAPALLLHFGLRDYLLAILRSDNHRKWLRRVTGELSHYLGDLAELGDGELAAALWLAQMRSFEAALSAMPYARMLDAEAFFARPAETLGAAAALFGRGADADAVARVVTGPLFATYAKNPAAKFANADRLARKAALAAPLADELDQAERWIAQNGSDVTTLIERFAAAALVP